MRYGGPSYSAIDKPLCQLEIMSAIPVHGAGHISCVGLFVAFGEIPANYPQGT
jgi:hypothetical protein